MFIFIFLLCFVSFSFFPISPFVSLTLYLFSVVIVFASFSLLQFDFKAKYCLLSSYIYIIHVVYAILHTIPHRQLNGKMIISVCVPLLLMLSLLLLLLFRVRILSNYVKLAEPNSRADETENLLKAFMILRLITDWELFWVNDFYSHVIHIWQRPRSSNVTIAHDSSYVSLYVAYSIWIFLEKILVFRRRILLSIFVAFTHMSILATHRIKNDRKIEKVKFMWGSEWSMLIEAATTDDKTTSNEN